MADPINAPAHYTDGRTIEPLDAILDWELPFCLGQVVKYVSRCGRKGSKADAYHDLEKAQFYLRRQMTIMLRENSPDAYRDDLVKAGVVDPQETADEVSARVAEVKRQRTGRG